MRRFVISLVFALFVPVLFAPATHAAQPAPTTVDFRGSRDHPILTRYPGAVIRWYDVQQFMPYRIATGPVAGYRNIANWVETRGRVTRIFYDLAGQRTHSEVYANYRKALADADFEIIADGHFPQASQADAIGSRKWMPLHYEANALPPSAGVDLMAGSATSGGSSFIAAKKERAAGTVYAVLGIAQQRADRVTFMIDVIEVDDVETNLVTIDADAMGDDIDEYGKVALYGLFFETDKADLMPTSKPALDEIAKLLRARPTLRVYVVGHTDAVGTLQYNMTLSENRARSIVRALTMDYSIAADRLEARGVGPLVPVFTNKSDGGRQKNRRVELVER